MIKVAASVLVSFLFGFFGIRFLLSNESLLPKIQPITNISPITAPLASPTPTPTPSVIGWMSYWDEVNSFNRLPTAIDKIDLFSPMLYFVGGDGRLTKYSISTKTQSLNLAKSKNIPILPTIGDDGDAKAVQTLLTDSKIQEQFISQLIAEAKKEGYTGWALDIEMLNDTDEKNFSLFVYRVSRMLHDNGLFLHMIVYGRVENETYLPAKAHNYSDMGKAADKVILMTYNFHNELTQPGPQTPPGWLRDVLNYATSVIPSEKIIVGLSSHGYLWEGNEVSGLTFPEVELYLKNNSLKGEIIKDQMSARVINNSQEVWYETGETIGQKIELVQKEYGINEFAIWRIGADDPTIWNNF